MRSRTRLAVIVSAPAAITAMLLFAMPLTAVADTFYEMTWIGSSGYTMQARFSYDETTAPPVISANSSGPTIGVETLDVTFRDPSGSILQTVSNVVGGVSSYTYLDFSFDTTTQMLTDFIDIGKDDGVAGDIWLGGPVGGPLDLQENLAGVIDTGPGPGTAIIDQPLRFYAMNWDSNNGYIMVGRFAYDRRFAPPVITASSTGPTNGLEYLELSFIDLDFVTLLQSTINVQGGLSTYGFLSFGFDTFTEQFVGIMDLGKDDGIAGDLWLVGDPLSTMNLQESGTGMLDSGGPVFNSRIFDALELNDDFASATPIGCDEYLFSQSIDPRGDLDVYRLTAPPGFKARIDIDADTIGSSLDPLIGVFDSFGSLIAQSDDDPAPGEPFTLDSYLDIVVPPDGVIFVVVSSYPDIELDGLPGQTPFTTGNYFISFDCAFVPGRLYASTGAGNALIEIDAATGAGTFLAPLGAFGSVTEIEFHPGGDLFGTTGGGTANLVAIDVSDLTEQFLCDYGGGALNGLEFVNGVLYGTHISGPGAISDLVIVNPPATMGGTCALNIIGPTGFGGIGGLAYNASNGRLYGCTVGGAGAVGPPGMLVTIDMATGLAVPVDAPNVGALACSALEYTSPAFGTENLAQLYAGIGAADPAVPGWLFRVNAASGTGVPVGPSGFPGISGLAFAPGPIADTDNDGVWDIYDNCTLVPNSDQRDTNSDGYGNACDPDVNNDCVVNFIDLNLLKASFLAIGDLDTDFDGDGRTNFNDLGMMKRFFLSAPGPSVNPCGIENASFETGDFSGWTVIDHPNPLFPVTVNGAGLTTGFGFFTSAPTDGAFAALHGFDGGPGSPTSIRIGQEMFVVPSTPVLRADYRLGWNLADFCSGCADRIFSVNIYAPGSAVLLDSRPIEVLPAATINLDTGNRLANVDLSAFAGMRIFVDFDFFVPENGTGPAFAQLDNVRFTAP